MTKRVPSGDQLSTGSPAVGIRLSALRGWRAAFLVRTYGANIVHIFQIIYIVHIFYILYIVHIVHIIFIVRIHKS